MCHLIHACYVPNTVLNSLTHFPNSIILPILQMSKWFRENLLNSPEVKPTSETDLRFIPGSVYAFAMLHHSTYTMLLELQYFWNGKKQRNALMIFENVISQVLRSIKKTEKKDELSLWFRYCRSNCSCATIGWIIFVH